MQPGKHKQEDDQPSHLILNVFGANPTAIRLYSNLGFEAEGLLQKALFIDGQWIDLVLMRLTVERSGSNLSNVAVTSPNQPNLTKVWRQRSFKPAFVSCRAGSAARSALGGAIPVAAKPSHIDAT